MDLFANLHSPEQPDENLADFTQSDNLSRVTFSTLPSHNVNQDVTSLPHGLGSTNFDSTC
jgi:hypothetical protein